MQSRFITPTSLWLLLAGGALLAGCGGHALLTSTPDAAPVDEGVPDSGPDAAGGCTTAQDCPAGHVCGFAAADFCAATGVCIVSDCGPAGCLITPAGECGCNGQAVIPVATGYTNAPANGKLGPCATCPATPPTAGQSCAPSGLSCGYDANCLFFVCEQGSWANSSTGHCGPDAGPDSGSDTGTDANPAGCPGDYALVPVGMQCAFDGLTCDYVDAMCACTTLPGPPQPTPHWECVTPTPGCPWPRPADGTPCTMNGQVCDYGGCTLPNGVQDQCAQGTWQSNMVVCGG